MFCPNRKCLDFETTGFHAEFVDGISACPTCGEALVETLQDSDLGVAAESLDSVESHELPTDLDPVCETSTVHEMPVGFEAVAEYAYPFEAELAAGRLEAAGLEARTINRGVLGASWLNPGRTGGIVLVVKTDQSEEASALLRAIEEDFEPDVPPEYSEDAEELECPECGSPHKRFKREHPIVCVLALSPSLRRFRGHRWICQECDHIWMVDNEPDI